MANTMNLTEDGMNITFEQSVTITLERYDELISKEYAYEAIKHAVESDYPFINDIAKALCFVKKRTVEPNDEF